MEKPFAECNVNQHDKPRLRVQYNCMASIDARLKPYAMLDDVTKNGTFIQVWGRGRMSSTNPKKNEKTCHNLLPNGSLNQYSCGMLFRRTSSTAKKLT
ncbi:hypothetical protein BLOT_014621 [Blomia tropicalis]|nr:hypothetical protein BLOT_014621 [Blomia tropicalis]